MYLFNQKIEITEAKAKQLFEQPNKTENKLDFIINLIKEIFNYIPKSVERKAFLKELSKEVKTIWKNKNQKGEIQKIIECIKSNNYSIPKIEAKFNKINTTIKFIKKANRQINTIDQQANIIKDLNCQISKKDHIIMEKTQEFNEVSKISEFRKAAIKSFNEKEKRTFKVFEIENLPTILRTINVGAFCVLGLIIGGVYQKAYATQGSND